MLRTPLNVAVQAKPQRNITFFFAGMCSASCPAPCTVHLLQGAFAGNHHVLIACATFHAAHATFHC
jgi:hypothetical protein